MAEEYVQQAADPQQPPRRGGGATVGAVLIIVGIVLLLAQFVPGIRWWTAWPLVIVIAGVIQAVTPGRTGWSIAKALDGLVTIAIGLALLAWTTGMLGAGFIGTFISLWPVLIIAVGFDLLSKALHMPWMKAVGSLIVIGAIALAVALSFVGLDARFLSGTSAETSIDVSESVGSVSEASLLLNAGVAKVDISEGDELITAEGTSPFGEPRFEIDRSGDKADLRLRLSDRDVVTPHAGEARLDARLSDEVLWDLVIETGVSELNADLSGLQVRSLELKPGVASCTARVGEVPEGVDEATIDVKAGISSVSILLPRGAEARVESRSGLTGHSIEGDFEKTGNGVWETPGFDEATGGTWIIRVQSGIGSIDIDTY